MSSSLIPSDAFARRSFDTVAAGAMLIPVAIAGAFIAAAISVTTRRPIFFQQERVGLHGEIFRIHKFRTMDPSLPEDQKLTRIACVLRNFSLDELPQIWNILRGDMSFFGPRPLPVTEYYTEISGNKERQSVRPGLFGAAQLYEKKSGKKPDLEKRLELDLHHIANRTLAGDIKIAFVHLGISFTGRGDRTNREGIKARVEMARAAIDLRAAAARGGAKTHAKRELTQS